MSYSTKVIYGYGFLISDTKIKNFSDNMYDDFLSNNYTIIIDNMTDFDCFFGLTIKEIEEGEVYKVPFSRFSHEEFMDMINEYKRFFPNESNYIPSEYIINQVY